MPLNDRIQAKWIRLLKSDGNLGGLYDPQRGIIRFISRGGTVDVDLVALCEDEMNKVEPLGGGQHANP
jgi:hypothetical protein